MDPYSHSFIIEVVDGEQHPARAAELIAATLRNAILENASAVLMPSAGRTPMPTYRMLRETYSTSVDWRRIHIVQMDEYRGIGANDPRSFAYYLLSELVRPLHVGGFTHFNDDKGVLIRPLATYEAAIGCIDLVIHGIGRNGHIGFNEPGASIDSVCRYARLARSTLHANFFGRGRPTATSRGHYAWTWAPARGTTLTVARDRRRKGHCDQASRLFAALKSVPRLDTVGL